MALDKEGKPWEEIGPNPEPLMYKFGGVVNRSYSITTMPLRCVPNCPRDFETSRTSSLTQHQARCPAYAARRTAAEHLRATVSNAYKQRIAARKKLKSMVCSWL